MNKLLKNREIRSTCNIDDRIYKIYKIGDRLIKADIKSKLQEIYDNLNISQKAKATNIEEWFETKRCKMKNPKTGKNIDGVELISKKKK